MIERVEPLGAVHPHHEDLPVTLGLDNGHVSLSLRLLPEATSLLPPIKPHADGGPAKLASTNCGGRER